VALMDWNTLTAGKTVSGSIRNWINYSKVDPEEVIAEAEDWMAMNLRTLLMQERVRITLLTGVTQLDFPTYFPGFLDPITVFLLGNYYLRYRALDDFEHIRLSHEDGTIDEGAPRLFALTGAGGGHMMFDTRADADYQMLVNYYKRPEPLSVDHQTNLYTTEYRLIFKEALLYRAYQSPKDSAAENEHLTKALGFIGQLKVNDDLKLRAQEQAVRVS